MTRSFAGQWVLAAGLCAAAMAMARSAAANVIAVPGQQPTIQAAMNAASNGDTIMVADGVYSGPGNYGIDFMGKAVTLRSANGPANCVIDAQSTAQSQHQIFYFHSGETNAAVVQGFTIKHGWQFNGPAFMLFNSSPTIRNCVITENHAGCWGGAIYFDSNASPKFTDCRITNNFSADEGGAIFGFEGAPVFTNCLIADNTVPGSGGAMLTWGNTLHATLVNCTVTDNSAPWAAAIYSNNIAIQNTIIWGNTGAPQQIYAPDPNTVSVRYSNVQGGYAGVGNINDAPHFGPTSDGGFHLMPGSPCIDAGDPATVVAPGAVDFDGDPRLFGVRIDIGVDEFRRAGDVNGDHIVNINDLLAVIGAWGSNASNNPADVNGDLTVNINDLLMVIANWG